MTPTASHANGRDNPRGILAMCVGMFGFLTNDMFVKLSGASLPTGEIIFLRGLMATAILALLVLATGAARHFTELARPSVGLRTVGEVLSTLLYLTALFHIPLANATAILQAMPLIMTVAAAVLLQEVVRWRRWAAVVVGFVGMILIVQPGSHGFNAYSLLAVGSLAFIALRDLSTRFIPLKVPGLLVSLAASVAVMLSGLALGLGEEWVRPEPRTLAYLAGAATCLSFGYFFLIDAMRHGELSVVAPFRYTILIWALIFGFLIWGDLPNALSLFGIVLIVGSGLYVFYRERVRSSRPPPETIPDGGQP